MNGLRAAAVMGIMLALSACPAPESPPPPKLNVVLLMVDTLRADHLSTYGYHRDTSPELDLLARDAVLFERTRAQSACTYPSVNSMLTSRYPAVFHDQDKGRIGIPDEVPSLAELLAAEGYATIAVSASPIVCANPSKHNPTGGFGRGFAIFDETAQWREAAFINLLALAHITKVQQPFFLYLHYMDPHDPYVPPKIHQPRFTGTYSGHDFIAAGDPNPIAEMLYDGGPEVEVDSADLQHLTDLYDEEISYFDKELGKLIGRLEEYELLDSTLIILAADHGEEFMEHGHIKHCRGLFDTLTRTPLVLRLPGGAHGGQRIPAPVQNLDIVPTVLDYLGISTQELSLDGSSLRPLIETEEVGEAVAFSDQGKWRSVDDGRFKLILDGISSERRMYDLSTDPGESRDIFDPESPDARRLGRALRQWMERPGGGVSDQQAIALAEAKERELKALGYLQ